MCIDKAIMTYVILLQKGKITIDDLPETCKKQVLDKLNERESL